MNANEYAAKALKGEVTLSDAQKHVVTKIQNTDAKRRGFLEQIQELDRARVHLQAQLAQATGAQAALGELLYDLAAPEMPPPPPASTSETMKPSAALSVALAAGKTIAHLADAD